MLRVVTVHHELLKGFRLGGLRIEPLTGTVSGNGADVHMPSRAVEVLLRLAQRPGELVTRDELLSTIWGNGHGSAEALSHAVSELRHGLGEHAEHPVFLQTVPRRGYRLLVEPTPLDPAEVEAADAPRVPTVSFWKQLMGRGVVQAGAAHLVVGWLLIQVADATFDAIGMPPWATAFVTYVVAAGFPVVLILAWFLEFAEGRMSVDRGYGHAPGRGALERNYLAIVGAYLLATLGVGTYQATAGIKVPDASDVTSADELQVALPVDPRSIAVSRFVTIGDNPEARIFIDGFAEDVRDRLARVPGLYVSSRTDAWTLPPQVRSNDVRRRLRVAWVLEGSVRLEGDNLRVAVQLVDTATGFHKVSRTFDRRLGNFVEVQKEITELTVANLRVALPADEQSVLTSADADVDAYVHYRRGREIFERPLTIALLEQSVAHFGDALVLDPEYTAAHAGLCRAYVSSYTISGETDYIDQAETACANALATNPNLHMVYTALGKLYHETNRLPAAEDAFRHALELNDRDVEAMQGLAWVYERDNRLDEAQAQLTRAMQLQPGNWTVINALGSLHFANGEYLEAAAEFRKVVYLDPENWQVLGNLGGALAMAGDFSEAAKALQRALQFSSEQYLYSNLGVVHYYMGDFDRSVAIHRQALVADPNASIVWLNLADALHFAGYEKEAREAFRRCAMLSASRLKINPGDVESLQAFAWARMTLGDGVEARWAMDRALQASPNDPLVFYYDALIRARIGDRAGVLDAVEKAVAAGYPRAMLAAEPYLEEFRAESRFRLLLSRNEDSAGQ